VRAWRLWELGDPAERLRLEEVDEPVAGPGDLVVDVEAVGLSFPDVLMCQGRYQNRTPIPFTPGGETVGRVVAVGAGVARFAPGDRVMGLGGGLAERVVLRSAAAVGVPEGIAPSTAAALPVNYGTTWHALHDRGHLRTGETLLVLGAAGGTGSAAVQLGLAAGARVVAVAGGPDKVAACRELGAHVVLDHRSFAGPDDLVALVRAEGGADLVYDPVGGDLAQAARRCLNWEGRYLVIGFVAGIPDFPLNHVLLKSYDVVGVHWGASLGRDPSSFTRQMGEVLALARTGLVDPPLWGPRPFDGGAEALQALADREVLGKAVVTR
jgi:NADPH2:quinone reductase